MHTTIGKYAVPTNDAEGLGDDIEDTTAIVRQKFSNQWSWQLIINYSHVPLIIIISIAERLYTTGKLWQSIQASER